MSDAQAPQRQFVNFLFYRVDPAWRRLPPDQRAAGKAAFAETVERYHEKVLTLGYSTAGIRYETDFMLWRITYDIDALQKMAAELLATPLGQYLTTPYSYLSMTKRSTYIEKHVHEGQEGSRLRVVPGRSRYLFVYPFVKQRRWYRLPLEERQRMMDEHIAVGHKYPTIRIHTTYSFGLDDQEFVLAFEGNKPEDFLDLVEELRASEVSAYTEREVPIFTCVRRPVTEVLDLLGG